MGTDQAVKSQKAGETAEVVELLPSAAYRLRLENETTVVAHAAGSGVKNFMRLRPGDRVRLIGSMRDVPRTLNIEKLRLLSRAEEYRKLSNPLCPGCRKRAKSMGRQAGFRCARCGQRFPASAATMERVSRPLKLGWYEPPVGSRRHLSKPLSRRLGLSERPAAA